MRIVRAPVALFGVFLVAAGILLSGYGQGRASGALVAFGLGYAAAGVVLIAVSLRPSRRL